MSDTRIAAPPNHPARMKLEPYSAEISLKNLSLGIDNIHYDVFLSPRFVEFTRKYLLDLIRQTVNSTPAHGKNLEEDHTAGACRFPKASNGSARSIHHQGENLGFG